MDLVLQVHRKHSFSVCISTFRVFSAYGHQRRTSDLKLDQVLRDHLQSRWYTFPAETSTITYVSVGQLQVLHTFQ